MSSVALAGLVASGCVAPILADPDDLLPGGKVRGVNLTPSPNARETVGGPALGINGYARSWSWAEWDWDGWFVPCLDNAQALGCNVVRQIGPIYGIWAGLLTRAEAFARWDQLHQACVDRGMVLYPCGQTSTYDRFGQVPSSFLQTELVAWADHMHGYGDCIALDLVNEATSDPRAPGWIAAVHTVTDLPCTVSTYQTSELPTQATFADFLDVHVYGGIPNLDGYLDDGKRVIVGEFGSPNSAGQATQTGHYTQMRNLCLHVTPGGHRVAGAVAWCVREFAQNDSDKYGLFDSSGAAKTWMTVPFTEVPKT